MIKGLFESFSTADKNLWRQIAANELKGQDPFKTLAFSTNQLDQLPYYDVCDGSIYSDQPLEASQNPFLGPRGWYNMPSVRVADPPRANKIALEHLKYGSDGIYFQIQSKIDVSQLLQNIELPYCSVFFVVDDGHPGFLFDFEQYVTTAGYDKSKIVGGVFWKKAPTEKLRAITQLFQDWENFYGLGVVAPYDLNPADQIAKALVAGSAILSETIEQGADPKSAVRQLAFSFNIGAEFFIEIAKLKSLRKLWTQVEGAYGAIDSNRSVFIHGHSDKWENNNYSPNENMIKATTAAISAVIGGCDGITIDADDPGNKFKNRISRNVLTILREESMMNATADPTAGSYYIENIVDQLSQVAWRKFQESIPS